MMAVVNVLRLNCRRRLLTLLLLFCVWLAGSLSATMAPFPDPSGTRSHNTPRSHLPQLPCD